MWHEVPAPQCKACGGDGRRYEDVRTGERGIDCTRCGRRVVLVPPRKQMSYSWTAQDNGRITF